MYKRIQNLALSLEETCFFGGGELEPLKLNCLLLT